MKLKDKIINSFKGLRLSGKRFPISIFFAVFFVLIRIYMEEFDYSINSVLGEKLNRISMVIVLAVGLSLIISLIIERFFPKDKHKIFAFHGLGLVFLLYYYHFLLAELNMVSMARYAGLWIFLIIAFFYVARLNLDDGYEKYVIDLFLQIFITFLYSIVLLFGIYFILFTIDQLFDINVKGKYYYYVFLIISQIFALAFLLSKLPEVSRDFTKDTYSKSLKVLLTYILIPLISVYTFILYIYFAKILIQWDWPKGLVSHLVLWYSAVSVGVIFLISPVLEEEKILMKFKRIFPKVILPILFMMFLSLGIRIREYGITENRYYVLVLGIWVTFMMLYLSRKTSRRNIIIPISLSLVILNSVFGPLSSFSISKYSQNKRYEKILIANEMIDGGQIIKNSNLSKEDEKEISNILSYFENNHKLEQVKYLDKDFSLKDTKEVFGFEYREDYGHSYDRYRSYYRDGSIEIVDLDGYEYLIEAVNSWDESLRTIGDLKIEQKSNGYFIISRKEEIIYEDNIKEIGAIILEKLEESDGMKEFRTIYEMSHTYDSEKIKIKFIFNNFSLKTEAYSGEKEVEVYDSLILLKVK